MKKGGVMPCVTSSISTQVMSLGHGPTSMKETDKGVPMKYQLPAQTMQLAAKIHNMSGENDERSTTWAPSEATVLEDQGWSSDGSNMNDIFGFSDSDSDPDIGDQDVFSKTQRVSFFSNACYQQQKHPNFDYGTAFMLGIFSLPSRHRKYGRLSL
eukprot:TRINITY_DN124525_c0_g1_i1.p1 TRINITY_DN124525_c0_g1~~TRINITY_DN124525_c0_g1_i1.p1  ORF type:complete len:155 (+),score=22.27 TRINITY_DN124525_c0_g1_i1:80-544(+)